VTTVTVGRTTVEALRASGRRPSSVLSRSTASSATGAIRGCDRFDILRFNADAERVRTLLALLEEGYGDRIHLSHDAACFRGFMVGDAELADEQPDHRHRRHGVTEAQIDQLTIENPRRFLVPARVAA
jgi:phosphotriesterase-related protein